MISSHPFFSDAQFYLCDRWGHSRKPCKTKRHVRLRKHWKNLLVIYYLDSTCGFHFQYICIKSLCSVVFVVSGNNLNIAWKFKIGYLSNDNFHFFHSFIYLIFIFVGYSFTRLHRYIKKVINLQSSILFDLKQYTKNEE